nr:MAG TPA: hypothetical protein [Caudoviricetes sp.]DAL67344.1 MAG TPA: hypothetical protein [Caudoviricetes sp.]
MKIKKIHKFLISHCFDENKSISLVNSKIICMFASTYILRGG